MTAGLAVFLVAALPAASLAAQDREWNDPASMALVQRAIARRAVAVSGGDLLDYSAEARGFVLFLAQVGEGFPEPPRLVKTDQLALQLYWRAPSRSKQRIVGWRDRRDLPTDINYHRDHLGIVQNNFGDRIRLGDGHEVRDVLHPLAPAGPSQYDYAIVDSLRIEIPQRAVPVFEVMVRPRDPERPAVVGSVFIDAADGGVVRFRFGFTRAAYRDDTVEDITVALQNGLWRGVHWLPQRQEIEIRRRTSWLDFPARGIIRGTWEIDGYRFNQGLGDAVFRGPEIVATPQATRDAYPWETSLAAALEREVGSVESVDLDRVRSRLGEVVSRRALSGLSRARLGAGGVSEYLRFNRVEGLTPGFGGVLRPVGGAVEVRARASVGLSDERVKGSVRVRVPAGGWTLDASASRAVRDVADEPVIAPVLNSIAAQELGEDYGDYFRRDRIAVALERRGPGAAARLGVWTERITPLAVRARPARGTFRPNPDLGTGRYHGATVEMTAGRSGLPTGSGAGLSAALEGGFGDGVRYARLAASGWARRAVGRGGPLAEVRLGLGTADLPPHRWFVLGGRGGLVGEGFRSMGGRRAVVVSVGWVTSWTVPSVSLGSFASTGPDLVVTPFVRSGWSWSSSTALPWPGARDGRPVVGAAVEWFHRLLRVEVGYGIRRRSAGVVFDVRRDLWGVL